MQKHFVTLAVCGLLAGTAAHASAQVGSAWTDRAYVTLNWANETGTTQLDGSDVFTLYEEGGRIDTTGRGASGPMFDFSGGMRVWKNFSVGLAFHRLVSKSDAAVTGSIPHPLFFSRPRTINETVPGLEHHEHAVHLQFGYMLPINDKLDVHVYGGPSFFRTSQDVVTTVNFGEQAFPFTTLLTQPAVARLKDSPTGGHFGVDVSYKLATWNKMKLGVGGFIRVSKASTDLLVLDTPVKADVGGFQSGLGLRVRF